VPSDTDAFCKYLRMLSLTAAELSQGVCEAGLCLVLVIS